MPKAPNLSKLPKKAREGLNKIAFIDADDTMWDVYIKESDFDLKKTRYAKLKKKKWKKRVYKGVAGECLPPFKMVDENVIVDSTGSCTIELNPLARSVIEELKESGYTTVVLSINDPYPVKEAIKAFDLDFDAMVVSSNLEKDSAILAVKNIVEPEDIVVVDDLVFSLRPPKGVRMFVDFADFVTGREYRPSKARILFGDKEDYFDYSKFFRGD